MVSFTHACVVYCTFKPQTFKLIPYHTNNHKVGSYNYTTKMGYFNKLHFTVYRLHGGTTKSPKIYYYITS